MIGDIRSNVRIGRYRFTVHGIERCIERGISPNDVEHVIFMGEIIENHPEDKYGPSCLMCGKTREGFLFHVQCSVEPVWIITAYDPTLSPDEWDVEFKRRRKR